MNASAATLDALGRFDGVRPTPERLAKGEVEIVELRDIDPKDRGRAVRVSDGWRPRTLYNRGRITKRQYAAAALLAELYEQGGFGHVGCQSFQPRVDSSPMPSLGPGGSIDARKRYMDGLDRLARTQRALVVALVIEGRTIDSAMRGDVFEACWLPPLGRNREVAASALFAAALEVLADWFRL